MYWAIVNGRREALSAFVGYIPKLSSVCSEDLRRACMVTSDHALFTQLNLERDVGRKCMLVLIFAQASINQIIMDKLANGKPLESSLDCPYVDHEVELHNGDGIDDDKFVALFRFKCCQKRLRIAENMSAEFVAKGW